MKKCPYCDSLYDDALISCPYCGKRPKSEPRPAVAPPPVQTVPDAPTERRGGKKGGNSGVARGLILGLPLGALLTALVAILLMRGLTPASAPAPVPANVALEDFRASECDIYVGAPMDVLFTVGVRTDAPLTQGVGLYDAQERLLATMNDGGVGGDETAGDGVYSARVSLSSDERARVEYHAACGDAHSEGFEISYYSDLTQDEFAEYARLLASVNAMDFDHANDFIAGSESVQSFEADAENRVITYRLNSGIVGVYEVMRPDFKSGLLALPVNLGADYASALAAIADIDFISARENPRIAVLRPFRGTQFQYDDFSAAGELLAQALHGTVTVVDDDGVSLDLMKRLSDYDIVLIDSHGGLSGQKRTPFIVIGEAFDADRFMNDPAYYATHAAHSADYLAERIYGTSSGRIAVNSRFFDKYYASGALGDSLWFLGTCDSLYDNSIASALVSKGAQAVLGFTGTVTTTYCNNVLFESLINTMLLRADTVGAGVSNAQGAYGIEDPGVRGTRFELRRDPSYRLVTGIDEGSGTLSGRVCEASDRVTPVPGAQIQVLSGDAVLVSAQAGENGDYTLALPEGDYLIHITAPGHIDFAAHAAVVVDENTYMETFLMIQGEAGQTGVAAGTVVNSLTGYGMEGVTLRFLPDWNSYTGDDGLQGATVAGTVVTESGGGYSIELPIGNYTAVATCEGFLSDAFNVIVQPGTTTHQNGTITPQTTGDSYLITLTWGENPSDLDSHMVGTLGDGRRFHVYYNDKTWTEGGETVCELDYDDTTSYGPEHVTLNASGDAPYYYFVYRYAGSGLVSTSGAKVTVHQGNVLIAEYNVPTDQGGADYWNVFAIRDGRILTRNTITSEAETDYAD